jgi:hypothetical protein
MHSRAVAQATDGARFASFERLNSNRLGRHCRFGACDILFQTGDLKFEPIEQRATLRGLSELLVPAPTCAS